MIDVNSNLTFLLRFAYARASKFNYNVFFPRSRTQHNRKHRSPSINYKLERELKYPNERLSEFLGRTKFRLCSQMRRCTSYKRMQMKRGGNSSVRTDKILLAPHILHLINDYLYRFREIRYATGKKSKLPLLLKLWAFSYRVNSS